MEFYIYPIKFILRYLHYRRYLILKSFLIILTLNNLSSLLTCILKSNRLFIGLKLLDFSYRIYMIESDHHISIRIYLILPF